MNHYRLPFMDQRRKSNGERDIIWIFSKSVSKLKTYLRWNVKDVVPEPIVSHHYNSLALLQIFGTISFVETMKTKKFSKKHNKNPSNNSKIIFYFNFVWQLNKHFNLHKHTKWEKCIKLIAFFTILQNIVKKFNASHLLIYFLTLISSKKSRLNLNQC